MTQKPNPHGTQPTYTISDNMLNHFYANTHSTAKKYACETNQNGNMPDIVILVTQSRSIHIKRVSGIHHQT